MSKQDLQQEIAALLGEESSEASEEADATKSGASGEQNAGASSGEGEAAAEEGLETSDGEEAGGQEGEEEEEAGEGEAASADEGQNAELDALRQEIRELKAAQQKGTGEEAAPAAEESALPELKPEAVEIDIMGDASFDEIVDDEEKFKSWAKSLVAKTQEATQDSIYKKLPQVIQAYAEQQLEVKSRAKEFYSNHPDLTEHKAEVAKSANLIAASEPDLDYDQFFKRVADHARYMLGIDPKKTKGESEEKGGDKKKGGKPALNQKSSRSNARSAGKQPELSGIEQDISEMLNQIEQ